MYIQINTIYRVKVKNENFVDFFKKMHKVRVAS